MTRLPQPGGDDGDWGGILNDFLLEDHNVDGTLKSDSVPSSAIQTGSVLEGQLSPAVQTKLNQVGQPGPANSLSIGTVTSGGVADATITGSSPNQTLNITLPQGLKGDPGTTDYDDLTNKPVLAVVATSGSYTNLTDTPDIAGLTTELSQRVTTTEGGGEVYYNAGLSGATLQIDSANGNVQQLTLSADCTIAFTNPPAGVMCSLTLLVSQDTTGSRVITWPGNVRWGEPGAPILSTGANLTDIMSLFTVDGGSKWYGVAGPRGF